MRYLILIGCCFSQIIFAQRGIRAPVDPLPSEPVYLTEQSIVYSQLSSFGLSESVTDISSLSGANPALISGYESLKAGLSYQFDLEDELRSNPFVGREFTALPQGFTIVSPFKSVVLIAGFNQRVNAKAGPINFSTNPDIDPSGTGQIQQYIRTQTITAANAGIGFSTNRFAGNEGRWNVGLRLNANYFRLNEEVGEANSRAESVFPSIHSGVGFEWGPKQRPVFSISAYTDINPEFTYTLDAELLSGVRTIDSLGNTQRDIISIERSVEGKMPDRFGVSALLQPWEQFSIFADVNTLKISETNGPFSSLTDRIDFGIGAIILPTDYLHLSSGLYNSEFSSEGLETLGAEGIDRDTFFLSHGIGLAFGKFSGSLAVLYSTNTDFSSRDRFMLKSGIGIEL